jgi:hypothetical protein
MARFVSLTSSRTVRTRLPDPRRRTQKDQQHRPSADTYSYFIFSLKLITLTIELPIMKDRVCGIEPWTHYSDQRATVLTMKGESVVNRTRNSLLWPLSYPPRRRECWRSGDLSLYISNLALVTLTTELPTMKERVSDTKLKRLMGTQQTRNVDPMKINNFLVRRRR